MSGRCRHAGCGRFIRSGEAVCRRHGEADNDGGTAAEAGVAAGGFRRPWLTGAYRSQAEDEVAAAVAAEADAGAGLRGELGVIRIALARLLDEEEDAGRFALGVARLVAVAVQAARVQQGLAEPAGMKHLEASLRRATEEL